MNYLKQTFSPYIEMITFYQVIPQMLPDGFFLSHALCAALSMQSKIIKE